MVTPVNKIYPYLFWIVFFFFSLPAVSAADSFENGVQAYKAGDYKKALEIFKPLAELRLAEAQYNLGVMYNTGQGVSQDYEEAEKWFRKAAEQGDADAQFKLGLMYDQGQRVPKDYEEAVKWYSKAAEQGNASAQNNLGLMYDKGQGVPQDYIEAHRWFNIAASCSSPCNNQTIFQNNRGNVEKRMTPDQIAEAQKLAHEWKPKPNKSSHIRVE